GHGGADDARRVAHDERHLFGRAVHGSNDDVALVLTTVIIHDDNHLALFKGTKGFDDLLLIIGHQQTPSDAAGLAAVAQIVIGDCAGNHRFGNRHGAYAHTR